MDKRKEIAEQSFSHILHLFLLKKDNFYVVSAKEDLSLELNLLDTLRNIDKFFLTSKKRFLSFKEFEYINKLLTLIRSKDVLSILFLFRDYLSIPIDEKDIVEIFNEISNFDYSCLNLLDRGQDFTSNGENYLEILSDKNRLFDALQEENIFLAGLKFCFIKNEGKKNFSSLRKLARFFWWIKEGKKKFSISFLKNVLFMLGLSFYEVSQSSFLEKDTKEIKKDILLLLISLKKLNSYE